MGLRALLIAPVLMATLVLSGCGEAPPTTGGEAGGDTGASSGGPDSPTTSDLVQPVGGDLRLGKPWYLVGGTLEHQTPTQVTLTFDAERLAGQAPVNSYTASCTATPTGGLTPGPIATTRMAGPEPEMKAESEYLALLGTVNGYTTVEAGELYLFAGDMNVLVYSVTPRPAPDELTISDETQALAASVVGKPEADARAAVEAADHAWRVVARDGESYPVTEDYSPTRIDVTIEDGTVTEATIG